MGSNLVVCGGTFDHFHKGHEEFLSYALSLGEKVIVGLTSDKYVKDSKFKDPNSSFFEPYKIREKNLRKFLSEKNVQNQVSILRIDDLFGPTLSEDLAIDAIVVSDDSKKGAVIINEKREKLGLKPLRVFISSIVNSEDGKTISSERIRNGEIDRVGKLYVKPDWLKTNFILPENLRQEFKKPIGLLNRDDNLTRIPNSPYIVTVGDETSKKFNENSIGQNISVVDFKIARKEKFSTFSELGFKGDEKVFTVNNPNGHISSELFSTVVRVFKSRINNRIILKIVGEEDLAVLPLILAAPLNAIIYYGQPNEGLVEIRVSEIIKDKAYNLVLKLRPI